MDQRRASFHEAGHAVVGLHLGFLIAGIEVAQGRLCTMCDLDSGERTDADRFVFLAGGIAGEKSEFATYDFDGCKDDQAKVSERGGASIETYLAEAAKIIRLNKEAFDQLRKKIMMRLIAAGMTMSITGGKSSYKLLTEDELRQICWQIPHT